jgi:hypothetical protein
MRRINLEPPKLPLWNQKWSQPGTGSKMTARAIAATIDVAMSAAFYFVPFTKFRSEVCGDSSVIVKDVSNGISNACCELRQLLAEHPELRNVYRAAQKVIPSTNPMDGNTKHFH